LRPNPPESPFQKRRTSAATAFSARGLDSLLVTALPNIRYLTNFTGSNGALLLFKERAVLYTDPRYELQASEEADCPVKIVRGPLWAAVRRDLNRKHLKRTGFEKGRITYEAYEALRGSDAGDSGLVPLGGILEYLRMVKSEDEVQSIRRSVATAAKAFHEAVKRIRPEMTEKELAAELDYRMRRLGAEKPAFETIVASGTRTAFPHANPTSGTIGRNRLVLIDMGASQNGYASDMTRMLFSGRPGAKLRRLYNSVLEAQLAAIAAVREGVTAGQVDRKARQVLGSDGLRDAFVHSTGHGLGLEIHEPPRIGRRDKTRLQAGMVITIEPGVYLEGFGGIRIEDTVLVTKTGCEVLTPTPKELILV